MIDPAGAVQRGQAHDALGRLAGGLARLGRFQPVVDGVADHVGDRVGQPLDHGLVDLGRLALGDQPHGLAGLGGDFADQARHALEHRLHRLGADGHDAVLDFARSAARGRREPKAIEELRVRPLSDHPLGQHGLVDDQFADQVDQAVDALEVDADGGAGGGLALLDGRVGGGGRRAAWPRPGRPPRRVRPSSSSGMVSAAAMARPRIAWMSSGKPSGRPSAAARSGSAAGLGRIARDLQLAVAVDEVEHFAHGGFVAVAGQPDGPGQVGVFAARAGRAAAVPRLRRRTSSDPRRDSSRSSRVASLAFSYMVVCGRKWISPGGADGSGLGGQLVLVELQRREAEGVVLFLRLGGDEAEGRSPARSSRRCRPGPRLSSTEPSPLACCTWSASRSAARSNGLITLWSAASRPARTSSRVVSSTWAKRTSGFEAEGAGAALDRVHGPEDRVDRL